MDYRLSDLELYPFLHHVRYPTAIHMSVSHVSIVPTVGKVRGKR